MWNPCPMCYENIKPFASKCPHCLSDLRSEGSDSGGGSGGSGIILTIFGIIFWIVLIIMLAGCSTVGGLVSGMGKDMSKAGEWISSK